MAGVHTYKQDGQDETMFAIDHAVGRGAVNRMDDVQLIQILINRYIDLKAAVYAERKGAREYDARVLDESGRQIKKLKVDGLCGPLTLAAILAAQRSLNRWRGAAVDGRIDPIPEGGASQYQDGTIYYSWREVKNHKSVQHKIMNTRFNAMYLLGVVADWEPNPPMDIFSLPDPLKSSLMRTSIGKSINSLARLAAEAAR